MSIQPSSIVEMHPGRDSARNPAGAPVRWWKQPAIEVMARSARMGSITLDVRGRQPWFESRRLAAVAVAELRDLAVTTQVPVYAYCVMPDHVHLVLGDSPACDLLTFVWRFKRRLQRAAWESGVRERLWSASFRGHVVRHEEQLRQVASEVLENPVRRGLARHWKEYPYVGSFELDV